MSDVERFTEVQRWLRYAWEDLVAGEAMIEQPGFVPRHACWLAQQAVERARKEEDT